MLARVIPADTMASPVMSTAPKKLIPAVSISSRTMGRMAAW